MCVCMCVCVCVCMCVKGKAKIVVVVYVMQDDPRCVPMSSIFLLLVECNLCLALVSANKVKTL